MLPGSQLAIWVDYDCTTGVTSPSLDAIPWTQPLLVQLTAPRQCLRPTSPAVAANRAEAVKPMTSRFINGYVAALDALLTRYPNVREVQVLNEVDSDLGAKPDALSYVKLLAKARDVARSRALILGPGFSPNALLGPYPRSVGMQTRSFAAAVRTYYRQTRRKRPLLDGFAYHPYWGFDNATTKGVAAVLDKAWKGLPQRSPKRGLKFWWTETGMWSAGPLWNRHGIPMVGTPADQATRVTQLAFAAKRNPLIGGEFNFLLADDGADNGLRSWKSGLWDAAGNPKPALNAFRSIWIGA
jgi:hypothetical protein